MRSRRDRYVLAATALVAAAAPLGAAVWIDARTSALAAELGAAAELPVKLGSIDADLTGAIRLSDVAFGDLVAAEEIEAAVALESLLSGELRADEIRVASPRVNVEIDATGDSDLARLVRRLAGRGSARGGTGPRLRRILVGSGSLTARITGLGEVSAEEVELLPEPGGVRVITGPVRARGEAAPLAVDLAFARSAAELRLPELQFARVLAVGGSGTVGAEGRTLALSDVAAGRLSAHGALELRASLDDGGIARPLAVDFTPAEIALRGEQVPLGPLSALAPAGVVLDGARATGAVRLRRRANAVEVEGSGTFAGLVLEHRALAAAPLRLTAELDAALSISPEAIAVARFAIASGAIQARLSGWLRRGAPTSARLDAVLLRARCADLLASLPADLRGPLDGMVLDGELGARARLAIDLAAPPGEGASLTAAFDGRCRALVEPPAADVSTLLAARDTPDWLDLRRIPGLVEGAFVSAEDGRFWRHDGFDLHQIARSLEIDLREGRLVRGGSTISQQLVKNAFLSHRRTFDRKLQEAILTWRLEQRLDKKQILEHYLNIIELGPRVYGIRAAARYWFGVGPRELSIRQVAFLAALTSEPTTMSRRVRRHGGLDPESAERVATVLRAMRRDGVIRSEDYEIARTLPMAFASSALRGD